MKPLVTILQSTNSGVDWDADQRDRFAGLMVAAAAKAYPQYAWDLEWQDFSVRHSVKADHLSDLELDILKEYTNDLSERIWETGDFWEPYGETVVAI